MWNNPANWHDQQAQLQYGGQEIPNEEGGSGVGWPAQESYNTSDPSASTQPYQSFDSSQAIGSDPQYFNSYKDDSDQQGLNYSTHGDTSPYPHSNYVQGYYKSQALDARQHNEAGRPSSSTYPYGYGQQFQSNHSDLDYHRNPAYQRQQGYHHHNYNYDPTRQDSSPRQGGTQQLFKTQQPQQSTSALRSGTPQPFDNAGQCNARMNPRASPYRPENSQPRGNVYQPSLSTLPEGAITGDISTGCSESLDKSYRMRDSSFFCFGKVFSMLHTEPYSEDTNEHRAEKSTTGRHKEDESVSVIKYGEKVYSNIRRFVVVEERRGFCYAFPISTYGQRACSKRGVKSNEHAIIYSTAEPPPPRSDEGPMLSPVQVEMSRSDMLHRNSRLNCGMRVPIQHNVKVKNLGKVHAKFLAWLSAYRKMELQGDFQVAESKAYMQQAGYFLHQDAPGFTPLDSPVTTGKGKERLALTETEHNNVPDQSNPIYDEDIHQRLGADENVRDDFKSSYDVRQSMSESVVAGSSASRIRRHPERSHRPEDPEGNGDPEYRDQRSSRHDDQSRRDRRFSSHSLPMRDKDEQDFSRKKSGPSSQPKGSSKYHNSGSSRNFG